ncbi:hypothetical protein Esti_002561 [Eimeria stiedai]
MLLSLLRLPRRSKPRAPCCRSNAAAAVHTDSSNCSSSSSSRSSSSSSGTKMDENKDPQDAARAGAAGDIDLPWVERYRPKSLSDVLSHDDIGLWFSLSLSQSSAIWTEVSCRIFSSMGLQPAGTGKTSTILAVARQLYGPQQTSHVLEMTEALVQSGNAPLASPKLKLVILDEADQMTTAAQNALRRSRPALLLLLLLLLLVLVPLHGDVRTECAVLFDLQLHQQDHPSHSIEMHQLRQKAEEAAKLENMTVTSDGYEALLQIARGDMRRLLNCMQAASMSHPGEVVDGELIHRVLGLPLPSEISLILQTLLEKDVQTCSTEFHSLLTRRGYSVRDWVGALHEELRRMDLPVPVAITLVTRLADIEKPQALRFCCAPSCRERLALGSADFVQLHAIIAAFFEARHALHAPQPSPMATGS